MSENEWLWWRVVGVGVAVGGGVGGWWWVVLVMHLKTSWYHLNY